MLCRQLLTFGDSLLALLPREEPSVAGLLVSPFASTFSPSTDQYIMSFVVG